jgi:hypothetical protein
VRGTRGTTPVNGAQLRARLGLPDAWAYVSSASAKAVRARPTREGRASSWTARLVTPGRVAGYVVGTVEPRPVAGGAVLERRRGERWKRVERFLTAADGSYRVAAPTRGRYRVRAGATASPEVRLR